MKKLDEKNKKNATTAACIIICVAVILIIIGIVSLTQAAKFRNDNMWDSSWFEDNSKANNLTFRGIALIIMGTFISLISGSVLYRVYNPQAGVTFQQNVHHVINRPSRKTEIKCPYCGTVRKKDVVECPGCGATNKELSNDEEF